MIAARPRRLGARFHTHIEAGFAAGSGGNARCTSLVSPADRDDREREISNPRALPSCNGRTYAQRSCQRHVRGQACFVLLPCLYLPWPALDAQP
jgi:hypothetical protein